MFTTDDPLGRRVGLTSRTWNIHIIKGHPELNKQHVQVQKTIEAPEFILPNEKDENRENYLRLCNLPGTGCLSILKVVVDFSSSTGDVVTAYPITGTQTQASTKRGVIYERP